MKSPYKCLCLFSTKGSEEVIGWSWAINVARKGYNVWCITNFENKDAVLAEKNSLGLTTLNSYLSHSIMDWIKPGLILR